MSTAWDPANAYSSQVLSNGNLTVRNPSNTPTGFARALNALGPADKIYCEAMIDATGGGENNGLGICLSGNSTQDWLGLASTEWSFVSDSGNVYSGGGSVATYAAAGLNAVVCMAVDVANKSVWWRVNNGNWNNSGTANPATNTGGLSFSSASGTFYVACSVLDSSSGLTARFSSSSWTYAPPSGFTEINAGTAGVTASAAQAFSLGQASAGRLAIAGTAAQPLGIAQASQARLAIGGSAAQPIGIGQSASGQLTSNRTASAVQQLALSQVSAAALAIKGTAAQALLISQAASSRLAIGGAASQAFAVGQQATGSLAPAGPVTASADQAISLSQSAIGKATQDLPAGGDDGGTVPRLKGKHNREETEGRSRKRLREIIQRAFEPVEVAKEATEVRSQPAILETLPVSAAPAPTAEIAPLQVPTPPAPVVVQSLAALEGIDASLSLIGRLIDEYHQSLIRAAIEADESDIELLLLAA